MLRSSRAVASALALTLCWFGVAACGDDDPGTDRPSAGTTTAAATPTEPSATASASETAEAMTPVQTVRAWVDAYNELARTGDQTVHDLTTPDCDMCWSLIESVESTLDAGGRYRGGDWHVAGTGVSDRGRKTTVVAGIRADGGSRSPSQGEAFSKFPSDKFILEFTVPEGTASVVRLAELE